MPQPLGPMIPTLSPRMMVVGKALQNGMPVIGKSDVFGFHDQPARSLGILLDEAHIAAPGSAPGHVGPHGQQGPRTRPSFRVRRALTPCLSQASSRFSTLSKPWAWDSSTSRSSCFRLR